jgi:hypothetical protein
VSRSVVRAVAAAALGALTGAACLLLVYGLRPVLEMDLAVSPPAEVTGLYLTERDPASGLTFAWTGEVLTIRLPGLDRHVPWHLEARARASRPDPTANPELAIFADGSHIVTVPTSSDFADIQLAIPARPDRLGLTISMRSSKTMVPGPHDPRALGVMVDWIRIRPEGIVMPPRKALAAAAVVPAIAALALALLGATAVSAAAAATGIGALLACVLARGFGPYSDYPVTVGNLAAWVWGVTLVVGLIALAVRRRPFSSRALFVAGFSAAAALLKLAVLLHPDMPVGDAMFHAHRFHDVLSGKLYFTSIAPGNYSFPYAPGLYVLALPFADLVRRGAADMALLRAIVVAVDAAAALLLYLALARAARWQTDAVRIRILRTAAVCAVVFYHLVPLDYRIVTVGNLTNAFAQSMATLALALIVGLARDRRASRLCGLLTLTLAAAFLSHTGTFAIAAAATAAIAGLFLWRGDARVRASGVAIALALAIAVVAAIVLYYAHFMETYRTEWARISVETATAAPDAGGRGIGARLAAVPRNLHIYLGTPVLILAAIGAAAARQRDGANALWLSVAGWLVACAGFLVLGILTPVDMRHYLAAIPGLAIAAGAGAAAWWYAGGRRRLIAAALVMWIIAMGLQTWWITI